MKFLLLIVLAIATPTMAAERTLSVTDFDRLRIDGGFIVEVRTGSATTAKIVGTQAAIDVAMVEVQGRQLVVRRNRSAWGGVPGQTPPAATIRLTVPLLAGVWVTGPAKVTIERLKGQRAAATLEGAGSLTVNAIVADRVELSTLGSGTLTVAGTVGILNAIARGTGIFDAGKLQAADAKLTSESSGTVTLAVKRAVGITNSGTGTVIVLGTPACTVRNVGSGTVSCGSDQPQR